MQVTVPPCHAGDSAPGWCPGGWHVAEELARCCPTVAAYRHLLTTLASSNGAMTALIAALKVAAELDALWSQPGLDLLQDFIIKSSDLLREDPSLQHAVQATLSSFVALAATEDDALLLIGAIGKFAAGSDGCPILGDAGLCDALLSNTRAFGSLSIEALLEPCLAIYQHGLTASEEGAQAATMLRFLEQRLFHLELEQSFQILAQLAQVYYA